ncbi:hypothetical protein EJD97_019255 [Solanum chilense]|uniref:Uncharacterized protein n=2 Tax=Solanum subgen. Lycopersicon TaxID=49274 RepID=A0A3Q7FRD6_SOLLC|nr:hypothetical protein EJD97_019255 [Solanum chilense]
MSSNQYWQSISNSDDEYLDHIKRMEKSPTMHPDIPLYPNVSSLFKNKLNNKGLVNRQKNQAAESQKKVQFADSNKNGKEKPTGFMLHKWRTYKVSA